MPGTFAYAPAPGTVLNAGSGQALHVVFTPADAGNYRTVSAEVTIDVAPLAVTVTAADRAKTCGETVVFAGSEFTAAGLLDGDAVTSVILASAGAEGAAAAGVYGIVASGAAGEGLENHVVSYVGGALTVRKAAPLVSLACSSAPGRPAGGGPVVDGMATCAVPSLPPGVHRIAAVYSGDASFAGSRSPDVRVTGAPPAGSKRGPVAALLSAAVCGLGLLGLGCRLLGRGRPVR